MSKRKSKSVIETALKSTKLKKKDRVSVWEGKVCYADEEVQKRDGYPETIPKKNTKGVLVFKGVTDFQPNLTPKEVLQAGSFGGTYFRPIDSSITGLSYDKQWEELPQNWLENLNIKKEVASPYYDVQINENKVKCGADLHTWESSGWIKKQDPYGWFQWYCRFYLGRRTDDDKRQIIRWKNCTGPKGRWKNNLIGKIYRSGTSYDDKSVSPVIRQVLLHWGYRLTEADFEARTKMLNNK